MRILLAEDDPILAEGLTCSLRRVGHAVDWVTDGVQAHAAGRGEHPHGARPGLLHRQGCGRAVVATFGVTSLHANAGASGEDVRVFRFR